MKKLILIFILFFYLSCNQLRNFYNPDSFVGIYKYNHRYGGSEIIIEKDYRFKAWFWSDVGVCPQEPTYTGRWEIVEDYGIIKLYSDKIPMKNIVKKDKSTDNFIIKLNYPDSSMFDLARVGVLYPDSSTVHYTIDSTGYLFLKKTPKNVRIWGMGIFTYNHYIEDYYTPEELKFEMNEYDMNLQSVASMEYNRVEINIEDEYPFMNGELYLLYDNKLYKLSYGNELHK